MGEDVKKGAHKELWEWKWDRFWDRTWVYGAALGLLVLILFSKVIISS